MRIQVQSLALLSGLGIQHCLKLWWHRHGSDPVLLWLWRRLAAAAPIPFLARESPYAGATLKKKKLFLVLSWFSSDLLPPPVAVLSVL